LQLDWAFAITVHSAQGSEWDRVLFLDDHLPSDRPKLLYTACTRAAKELVICDVSPR
jgi:exodeoxyribonuclease-5